MQYVSFDFTHCAAGSTDRDEVQLGRNLLDGHNEDGNSQLGDKMCKGTFVITI